MRWGAVILGVILMVMGFIAFTVAGIQWGEQRQVDNMAELGIVPEGGFVPDVKHVPLAPVMAVVGTAGGLVLLAVGAAAATRARGF